MFYSVALYIFTARLWSRLVECGRIRELALRADGGSTSHSDLTQFVQYFNVVLFNVFLN